MAKTAHSAARCMLDFAARSLALRSDGWSPAIAPSKLPSHARVITAAFFVRSTSIAAKTVTMDAGSLKIADVKKAPAKQSALTAAKGKAAAPVRKAPAAAKRAAKALT